MRVIGGDGKQIGLLSLTEALKKAQEEGLDLVEIAPTAKPPVARIVELGKFTYEQEKKARIEKKKSKPSDLKEIRFSPFIGEHDFENRIKRIEEFLEDKHKIRIVVVFLGRQMGSKSFGYELIKRILNRLEGRVIMDAEPKFIGRHLFTTISPVNKTASVKKEEAKTETN